MLDEDIPEWEHTITAMVKLRQRNRATDADKGWELAKDDEESWYVVSIDWDNLANSDTIRIK
jgi:hypothetical protein